MNPLSSALPGMLDRVMLTHILTPLSNRARNLTQIAYDESAYISRRHGVLPVLQSKHLCVCVRGVLKLTGEFGLPDRGEVWVCHRLLRCETLLKFLSVLLPVGNVFQTMTYLVVVA